jgi:hypothetical protein
MLRRNVCWGRFPELTCCRHAHLNDRAQESDGATTEIAAVKPFRLGRRTPALLLYHIGSGCVLRCELPIRDGFDL